MKSISEFLSPLSKTAVFLAIFFWFGVLSYIDVNERIKLELKKDNLSTKIIDLREEIESNKEKSKATDYPFPDLNDFNYSKLGRLTNEIEAVQDKLGRSIITRSPERFWYSFFFLVFLIISFHLLEKYVFASGYSDRVDEYVREAEALQKELGKENIFQQLIQINFKYLDIYYQQTQSHAKKSFIFASIAAFISLMVIVVGVVMMLKDKDQGVGPMLTVAVGVFGELIATVFFYLYNRTVLAMDAYHKKLVLTQNVNLAMKVTEGMEGNDRAEAQKEIVKSLVKDINVHLSSEDKAPERGKSKLSGKLTR